MITIAVELMLGSVGSDAVCWWCSCCGRVEALAFSKHICGIDAVYLLELILCTAGAHAVDLWRRCLFSKNLFGIEAVYFLVPMPCACGTHAVDLWQALFLVLTSALGLMLCTCWC